jgi:hypothetical protein
MDGTSFFQCEHEENTKHDHDMNADGSRVNFKIPDKWDYGNNCADNAFHGYEHWIRGIHLDKAVGIACPIEILDTTIGIGIVVAFCYEVYLIRNHALFNGPMNYGSVIVQMRVERSWNPVINEDRIIFYHENVTIGTHLDVVMVDTTLDEHDVTNA